VGEVAKVKWLSGKAKPQSRKVTLKKRSCRNLRFLGAFAALREMIMD
jgi:hypothetical protein